MLGEDVGRFGGVFRATQGLFDEFGGDRVIDTPAGRGRHHRHRHRHGALRPAAGGRDPVRRLHLPGLGPAGERGGQVPVPLRRPVRLPHGGPRPRTAAASRAATTTRSRPRRTSSTPPGSRWWSRPRPTTPRGSCSRRSAIPTRSSSSSRSASTGPRAARCPAGEYLELLGKARITRRGSQVTILAWGAMWHEADQAAREAEAEGLELRGDRPALAPAARPRRHRRVGLPDRPGGDRARGPTHLWLRRRAGRPDPGALLPPPGGAGGPRHRLRHPLPLHATRTSTCPAPPASSRAVRETVAF